MRYFEIVKPSARRILADADREKPLRDNRAMAGECALQFPRASRASSSAVTSAAFITPAFAIAQGSSCPRN